ncbi:DNA alkylation repair protein [Actinomadura logoneensis]|uniref:DNA alkylation repair protein n=1 Tax=Actinomadura logoneensis TaxID=2293572 RepID=A0A372JCH1_9ACTN|nr:DNA alkylation repair protein [Actinomadura logoneensis]RFU37534.1 DNA alkylation repair protein [Actinomadura logoneensis]
MDVPDEVTRIVRDLRAQADPARAEAERGYLKSSFAHIGVPVPVVRRIAVASVRARPSRDDLLALADGLWVVTESGRPVHEARLAAVEVLIKRVDVLEPGDLAFAERLVRDSSTWALVDNLAEKVVGVLALSYPQVADELDTWVGDEYLWIRRAAILALLAGIRRGTPDVARVDRYGEASLDETEFFIRKALGWVLRELSRKDPAWVADWTSRHLARMSTVTFREAVRHLPPETTAALTRARP